MSKRVEGVYPTIEEALAAVDRLKKQGYSRTDISVVANEEVRNSFSYTTDVDVTADSSSSSAGNEDHRSLWETIKDAFTMDDSYADTAYSESGYDATTDPLYAYRDEISRGSVVVLVEEGTGTGTFHNEHLRDTTRDVMDGRDETIELREERLEVDKQKLQTGEVRIGKRIVEETETVEVPVTREEITIERRPVTDRRVVDGDLDVTLTEEEIVIPVTEEQVMVNKDTRVVEEVEVHKEAITEEKRISETVRREELDVDTTGGVHVDDTRTLDNDRDRR